MASSDEDRGGAMTGATGRADTGRSAAEALSSATLAFGSTALVIAAVLVVLRNVNSPGHNAWPALLLLVPLAVIMLVSHHWRRPWIMVIHLLVGPACIGLYSLIVLENAPAGIAESPFILSLPQMAFVYTIAPSVLGVRSVVFIALAYLFGQASVLLAACTVERFPTFDFQTAAAAFAILVVGVANLALRRRAIHDRRVVERAGREADAAAYQRELEAQVVALFHDTVLSELTVLGTQQPGPLKPSQRASIDRDLSMIAEGAWWSGDVDSRAHGRGPEPLPAVLDEAVAEAQGLGVQVDALGDLASLNRLDAASSAALALALRQAFVNVARHSGSDRAEIVVDGAPDAVVVTVADPGVGFDPQEVPADRLGVSQSILGRIRDAGGDAQLFTSPGNGTAYMFTLPVQAGLPVQAAEAGEAPS
ncbi:sensor histidine kinase [Herbiconiux liukaitaii]|uniref:sensor histidine kinase n=1 Tax=Herbiconiux liukaitaii TaxID=3342799 RepID=UPI0035BA5491